MAFPTSPSNLDTYSQYIYKAAWKKELIADSQAGTDGFLKFHNGVMIQWGQISDASDASYHSYPETFYEEPVVMADAARNGYITSIGGSNIQPEVSRFRFYIKPHDLVGDPPASSLAFWMAFGLWKPLESVEVDITQDIKGSRVYDVALGAYKKIPSIQAVSNANGMWIEFDDGFLIQWGKKSISGDTVVSYHRQFAEEPIVLNDVARGSYRCTIGTNNIQPTVSSFETFMRSLSTNAEYTSATTLNWVAFGRAR